MPARKSLTVASNTVRRQRAIFSTQKTPQSTGGGLEAYVRKCQSKIRKAYTARRGVKIHDFRAYVLYGRSLTDITSAFTNNESMSLSAPDTSRFFQRSYFR